MTKTYNGIHTGYGVKVDEDMHGGPGGSILVAYYECESIHEAVETALELLNTNYEVTIFSGSLYNPRRYHSRKAVLEDFNEFTTEYTMERFTRGYVDTVVSMMISKEEARKFLRRQLYEIRNLVTREHYYAMFEYIDRATK